MSYEKSPRERMIVEHHARTRERPVELPKDPVISEKITMHVTLEKGNEQNGQIGHLKSLGGVLKPDGDGFGVTITIPRDNVLEDQRRRVEEHKARIKDNSQVIKAEGGGDMPFMVERAPDDMPFSTANQLLALDDLRP